MPGDQNRNAGNEGDVVKHPALLAALISALDVDDEGTVFRYADIYAGRPTYTLPPNGGWVRGIGQAAPMQKLTRAKSEAVRRWAGWCPPIPAAGFRYPGSVTIALDAARSSRRELRISAWDKSADASVDLRQALGRSHRVCASAASVDDPDVARADFLFVDPLSLEEWSRVKAFLRLDVPNVLVWLPVSADNSGAESKRSQKVRAEAPQLGFELDTVCWQGHSRHTHELLGCHLVHRFSLSETTAAMRDAVGDTATAFGWSHQAASAAGQP